MLKNSLEDTSNIILKNTGSCHVEDKDFLKDLKEIVEKKKANLKQIFDES